MSAIRTLAPALVVLASLASAPDHDHAPRSTTETAAPAAHPMGAAKVAQIESTFRVEVGESTLVVIGDAHMH